MKTFYSPPTNLREGNVDRTCWAVIHGGSYVTLIMSFQNEMLT